MEARRLYVGGLSEKVLEKDIKKKFAEFGAVKNVELRCKENYGNRRYFAYIDIEADKSSIDNCIRSCNNLDWKDGVLKVQPAKESYLQTIQKDILHKQPTAPEAATVSEKRTKKKPAVKSEESSDESDGDAHSYLGVPAWTGFKLKPAESEKSTPGSKQTSCADPPASGVRKRLYVGGLPESALEADVKKTFQPYGSVKSVEIKCKDNYGDRRYFAYVDLDIDECRVDECIRQCNNRAWRGAQLKVQLAKESFLQKAQNKILERKTYEADSSFREACTAKAQNVKNDALEDEAMETSGDGQRRRVFGSSPSKRKTWADARDSGGHDHHGTTSLREQQPAAANHTDNRNGNQRNRIGQREACVRHSDGDMNHRSNLRRDDGANAFESERKGLFDEIDAADELGLEQDELLSEDDESGRSPAENVNDPISEQNLKELFGERSDGQGFVLSSLFADQLTVEESRFEEDEDDRRASQSRHDVERFEEEYWKRAEKLDQRSWQEMVHRNDRGGHVSTMPSTFFMLPGDPRLEEGSEVFRTDKDPAQFVDCWREQAEQLTQRLFQRKRNTRILYQMAQRAGGHSSKTPKQKKAFRKAVRKAGS